jgi:hypothetical protein
LQNVNVPGYLKGFRVLLLSYDGQKPLTPEVHAPIADWVRRGGVLVFCDADADPYLQVREWWNSGGLQFATPREHLFKGLGVAADAIAGECQRVGKGGLIWLKERPAGPSLSLESALRVVEATRRAVDAARLKWIETNYLLIRRGPYVIGAGLDETIGGKPRELNGRFVDLFDPELTFMDHVTLEPCSRRFLLDLNAVDARKPALLAAACKALPGKASKNQINYTVEGVGQTDCVMLFQLASEPRRVLLAGQRVEQVKYEARERLLWLRFINETGPRNLSIEL